MNSEEIEEKKAKNKRRLVLVLTLLVNLVVVGYIAIRELKKDAGSVKKIPLSDMNFGFLILGIALFFVALFMDYCKYRHMLITSEGKDRKRAALEVCILGKYYDNVTPFGAGGQPFQMLCLRRHKFSAGTCGSLPVAGFLTQQMAFVLICLVVLILNPHIMDNSPVIRYGAYVGIVMYALLPVAIILFAIFPKALKKIVKGFLNFLGKIHILKNSEASAEKVLGTLDEYTRALRVMTKRPHFLFRLMFYSIVYQMAILSIPFFAIHAFGGSLSWWTVFSMTVYIYSAITIIPTPGNSGAAEGSFYAVFSSLSGGYLFWAMIVWRILVYYSWLAAGISMMTHTAVRKKKTKTPVPRDRIPNVGIFNDLFYPTVDGVVRTVDAYGRHMKEMGSDCCVVVPHERDVKDELSYPVIRTPSLKLKISPFSIPLAMLGKKGRDYFRNKSFDILHTHSPFFVSNIALRMARKRNIPVVATFHSKYYDDVIHYTHSKFLANLVKNHIVEHYSKMDMVWACSKATAETLREYGFHGKIGVLENGIEPFPESDEEALKKTVIEKFSIPTDKPVLLFVGQQIWHKNLGLILESSKVIKDRGEDFALIIAGAGNDGRKIRHYCHHLGLDDRVKFLGRVEDPSLVHGLYLASDLLFFPSLYDNAPLVLREAALAHLPALLAEGSNSAEPVIDGVNGYTAVPERDPMADKLQKILHDPNRKEVGEAASRTIPIPWSKVCESVIEEYRNIELEEF
ncbi:MAG: flippase-like domain-containing protein [Lachnospiraceae bacterium]|nr:flippase-like domain-containing protein [Lachnospiraceae bacterium]